MKRLTIPIFNRMFVKKLKFKCSGHIYMEDVNVKVRPYRVEEHYKNDLTDGPSYYRIRLDSQHKRAGSTNTDAYFDVRQIFPNHNKGLLTGNWEVHLESFNGYFENLFIFADDIVQGETQAISVALPDMIQSSNDWMVTGTGCRQSHVLADVSCGFNSSWVGGVLTYAPTPTSYTAKIGSDTVGCKVDLSTFDGVIHIRLQELLGAMIDVGVGVGEIDGAERWQASLVFVKKP